MADEPERRFLGWPVWKWSSLSSVVGVLGLAGIVIGGVVAFFEVQQRRAAAQGQATLDLLDTWEQDGYLAAYRALDRRIVEALQTVPEADLEAARTDETISAQLFDKLSARILDSPAAREDFDTLIYFFQRLAICVETELCSEAATMSFFRSTMQSFTRTFAGEIGRRRAVTADFADGLILAD